MSSRRVLRVVPAIVALMVLPLTAAGEPVTRPIVAAEPLAVQLPVLTPRTDCAALAGVDVAAEVGAGTGIISAGLTAAAPGYPVCDVKGVIAPQIQFEVQLPTQTYRQRYLQTGCGGLCGTLAITVRAADGCVPVTDGTSLQRFLPWTANSTDLATWAAPPHHDHTPDP